jgi:hypothetical protein
MTSERTRSRALRAPVAAAVLSVALASSLLAGCSHGSSDKGSDKAGAATGAAARVAPTADPIVNDPKARPSVSMKNCAATTSGWAAGGTVTNSKDKQATFTIVVSFTTKQSTVLARGETRVTVKAGATKSWTTSANFAKSQGTQCVLRGVAES